MGAVVVPVKHLDGAKSRLGGTLDSTARRTLGLAMLTDVLAATAIFPGRLVVTSDPDAAGRATQAGFRVLPDPGGGLNAAVESGTQACRDAGWEDVTMIPADVPLIAPADLESILAVEVPVVIVPSGDGGTAALRRHPPDAIPAAFGEDSAGVHLREAERLGIPVKVLNLPRLRLDVDDYEDVVELANSGYERESVKAARALLL
jgi:2-phospho-L-lactate guanylyltransferase